MAFVRVQVTIPADTTIPSDAAVNVWHFEGPGSAAIVGLEAGTKLTTFYQAIDGILSADIASPLTLKYYDLEDVQPRVPFASSTIIVTPSATSGLPHEVALCLSYKAATVSGQSPARRRGRIFLGPLTSSITTNAGGRVNVDAATMNTVGAAATALASTGGGTDAIWNVFSPTTAGAEPWSAGALSSAFYPVTDGYIDNAFDTIRSRGTDATVRTLWT